MDLVDRQLPRNLTADDSDSHLLLLHSVSLIRDFRDPQDRLVDRRRMRGPAVHLNVVVSRESRPHGPEASRGRAETPFPICSQSPLLAPSLKRAAIGSLRLVRNPIDLAADVQTTRGVGKPITFSTRRVIRGGTVCRAGRGVMARWEDLQRQRKPPPPRASLIDRLVTFPTS